MTLHLQALDLIDSETEAHYSFKTMRPATQTQGRISTTCHDHDFFELFLIRYGRINHWVNGSEFLLPTGSLVFVRPSDCHAFHQVDAEDCGLINLAFPAQTITALFNYLGQGFNPHRLLKPEFPPTVLLSESDSALAIARLNKLPAIPHTQKDYIRTHLRLLLVDFLGRFFGTEIDTRTDSSSDWLQLLCARMKDPINLRGGVSAMQSLACISPEHLSRTFRKELHCTPTQYVNQLRLTYAANLLMHTDQPIIDISFEVGLENLSYFYRIFKQRYGLAPAKFRQQNRRRSIP